MNGYLPGERLHKHRRPVVESPVGMVTGVTCRCGSNLGKEVLKFSRRHSRPQRVTIKIERPLGRYRACVPPRRRVSPWPCEYFIKEFMQRQHFVYLIQCERSEPHDASRTAKGSESVMPRSTLTSHHKRSFLYEKRFYYPGYFSSENLVVSRNLCFDCC